MTSRSSNIRNVALAALLIATAIEPLQAAARGDPARGAKLHEQCLQCHGTAPYMPEKRKIKTLKALRKEVERWGDCYNPAMNKQEIDDLVAWLNANFYKFPE